MKLASLIAAAAIACGLTAPAYAEYTPSQMLEDCKGFRGEDAESFCIAYVAGARDALLSINISSLKQENIDSGKGANVAGICIPMTAKIQVYEMVDGVRPLKAKFGAGMGKKFDDVGAATWLMAALRKMYPCK